MNKEDFLNRLEYLLQDISEDDKRDAIDYYRDYLEEAGPENEPEVLNGFESPERIAAIIRTDLLGGMDKGGEFTENGYGDRRFETHSLPSVRKEATREQDSYAANARKKSGRKQESSWAKYLLIAIIVFIMAPAALAAAAGLFGGAVGIGGILFALLVILAVLTVTAFVTGIALIFYGIAQLFVDIWLGVMGLGAGLAFIGAGFLLFVCAVLFYGRFIPWLVRGLIGILRRIFGKSPKQRRKEQDKTQR